MLVLVFVLVGVVGAIVAHALYKGMTASLSSRDPLRDNPMFNLFAVGLGVVISLGILVVVLASVRYSEVSTSDEYSLVLLPGEEGYVRREDLFYVVIREGEPGQEYIPIKITKVIYGSPVATIQEVKKTREYPPLVEWVMRDFREVEYEYVLRLP